MPSCDLNIELPEGVDHVPPGGELDVTVHVECDGPLTCKALTLTRLWRTHGKGNRDSGGKEAMVLFSGDWTAGRHSYPATVTFPGTPETYHGETVNVDWFLEARADVPFKIDPKADCQVLLVNTAPPRPYEEPDVWSPRPVKLGGGMIGCFLPAIVGLVIAVALFWSGWQIAGSLLGALCAYGIVGSRSAKGMVARLGHIAVEVHPGTVAPGESVAAQVELRPEGPIQVKEIRMTLVSTEKATSGSGSNSTDHVATPVSITEVGAVDLKLDGLTAFEHEFSFTLPVDTPPTFEAPDNELFTSLTLHVQVDDRKTYTHSTPLTVQSSDLGES
ncbi:MAG: sporulation protein [Planctomycetota bacterium]